MTATKMPVDFRLVDDDRDPLPIRPIRARHGDKPQSTSRKQMRARLRRQHKKGKKDSAEAKRLYKPIEQWDAEELARGRPRDKNGTFGGRPPLWITREIHEESMTRFRQIIRDGLNANANTALSTIGWILACDELDEKGRPVVSPSTKLDAAKFLFEQVVGKPKQLQEMDISVKLQGILASAVVTPGSYVMPAIPQARELTSPRSWEDADWSSED